MKNIPSVSILSKIARTIKFVFLLVLLAVVNNSCDACQNMNCSNPPLDHVNLEVPSKGGVGIVNIGNSCYLSAALQMIKAFYPHLFENSKTELAEAGQRLMKALDESSTVNRQLVTAFLEALRKACSLDKGTKWPGENIQEDAQEVLSYILNYHNGSGLYLENYKVHPNGKYRKYMHTDGPHPMLPIPINEKINEQSLQIYIDAFFSPEPIEVYWDNSPLDGIKKITQLDLSSLTKEHMLILHLKRFFRHIEEKTTYKIDVPIHDPLQFTMKKEYIRNATQDISYSLVGFILHIGTYAGGHYVAYAKKDGVWYVYNDAHVSSLSPEEAEKAAEKAYIAFYTPVRSAS